MGKPSLLVRQNRRLQREAAAPAPKATTRERIKKKRGKAIAQQKQVGRIKRSKQDRLLKKEQAAARRAHEHWLVESIFLYGHLTLRSSIVMRRDAELADN